MISCDTNILFPACDTSAAAHDAAREFLKKQSARDDFCLCEQVLLELYCLLRNPTVCRNPLPAAAAVAVVQGYRSNPLWRIVDVVLDSSIMTRVWECASGNGFPYRGIFDARLAFTLRHHGVTEFATCNEKDFHAFGFARVWNPLVCVR
jgi:toxin-antitoxin system PIN domain toxin